MSSIPPNAPCPCDSGKKYKKCCRVYHMGVPAPTPEKLMRSRYTAYAAGNMTYIMATTHPESECHLAAVTVRLRGTVNDQADVFTAASESRQFLFPLRSVLPVPFALRVCRRHDV
ncbi:MAG: YchJ family metal-binding protein, partial [Chloroflexota bacterium]